jgi:hypothetical protein
MLIIISIIKYKYVKCTKYIHHNIITIGYYLSIYFLNINILYTLKVKKYKPWDLEVVFRIIVGEEGCIGCANNLDGEICAPENIISFQMKGKNIIIWIYGLKYKFPFKTIYFIIIKNKPWDSIFGAISDSFLWWDVDAPLQTVNLKNKLQLIHVLF